MPRQKRNIFPGQDVHTIFRSIDNSFLFEGNQPQNVMRATLTRMIERYKAPIYAWVGMSNHQHVFNQAPTEWPDDHVHFGTKKPIFIGDMFRDCFSYFARLINVVRKRVGGVIRDRTKTVEVDSYEQALTLIIYIFMNPVRAGMVKHPSQYPFHNYKMYASGVESSGFTFHPAYLALGKTRAQRKHQFLRLLEFARKDWAARRWMGISGSHGPGRNKKKNNYAAFQALASSWICILQVNDTGPP